MKAIKKKFIIWNDSLKAKKQTTKEFKMTKLIQIIFKFDDELGDLEYLPTEVEIPEGMTDEEEISDYISDEIGFCHNGYVLED